MLTYPRFAKACYAFFAVAVVAAVLKLSISGTEPALLRMLPTAPTASAVEPAAKPPEPEDPRLGSFSDDGEAERLERVFSRTASREDVSRAAPTKNGLKKTDDDPDGPFGDASIFRRPSLGWVSSEPVCGDLGGSPRSSRVVFPLPEKYFDSYDDTWGAARPQGGHEGSDLMSPAGTPEFALTDGKLVGVAGSNENGWNKLGGYTVMLEAAYDIGPINKGDLFYYAHLDRESSLPVGTTVRAGQRIGTAGDTGEGPEVTRGKFPPHLHLGWYDADLSETRSEAESEAMNPYPLLLWLERNGGAVSGGTDASYCQAPQGPNPSTGEPDWPFPYASGERPDLDTGGGPSPVARKHGQDHPKRDRDGGDRSGGEKSKDQGSATHEGNEAGETKEPRDEAKKLPLRKKPKARLEALLRDLPSGVDGRNVPEDQSDEGRSGGKGDGRKGGEQNGKEQQEIDRPNGDRPHGEQEATPEEIPDAPAPVAAPDRRPRPVPERPDEGQAGAAEEEQDADKPPKVVREIPATEPGPDFDAGGSEVADGTALLRKEDPPVPAGIEDAPEGEDVAGSELDEGE